MPKPIARLARTWSGKSPDSLILALVLFLLNLAYFPRLSFPVDEGKWLLLQVVAPALALYCVAAALLRQEKITLRITPLQGCLLLFFGWAAISGIWALNLVAYPASLLDLTSLMIFMLFFSVALNDPEQRTPLIFLKLFSTLVATVGILQYFGWDGGLFYQHVSPASFFVNKNYASPIVAASLPLLGLTLLSGPSLKGKLPLLALFYLNFTYLLIAATKSSWFAYFGAVAIFTTTAFNHETYRKHFAKDLLLRNLALIVSAIFLGLALAFIHDQGSFPAMDRALLPQTGTLLALTTFTALSPLFGAGLIYLWRQGARRHRLLPYLVLLFLLAGGTTVLISQATPVLERVNASLSVTSAADSMRSSWSTRIPLWLNSLAIIGDHPLLGVGLGSFEAVYPLYHGAVTNDLVYSPLLWIGGAHNDPLQLLVELGLVGLTLAGLCFALLTRYFHALMKTAAPAAAPLLTGCYLGGLTLVLESLFNPVCHQPSSLLLLALLAGTIHSALYREGCPSPLFILHHEITPEKRSLYLLPLAALFFLVLCVSAPWAGRRYQAFSSHKEAIGYSNARLDDACYQKLQEAANYWPYSSIITSEVASASYLYMERHFNDTSLQQAKDYNRRALRALPYHYNTNLVRIALLKYLPGGRSEIGKYAPLLLQVAPDDKLEEARRAINF